MRVRYTEPAVREFEAVISYFLAHAPRLAPEIADAIDKAVTQLLKHPYSGQETEMRGIRELYLRRFRYLVFYTVEGSEVVILHLRHAARRRPWEEESPA